MSADEDTELRDLIVQTLESNGVISKIKAELRASVFLALEEEGSFRDKIPFINKKLAEFVSSSEGKKTVSLVREFLEFFNLNFTLAVFDPEVNCTSKCLSREELRNEYKLDSAKPEVPLITSLLNEWKTVDPSYVSTPSDSGFIQPMPSQPKESPHEDVKLDSVDSSFTSNHITEGLMEDLSTNETSYDAFFDGPLPTNSNLGLFNTFSNNIPINQKETKDEQVHSDSLSNKSDQNSLLSYLNNKQDQDSKLKVDKEGNVFNTEPKKQDPPSLFPAKTDSITTLRDFPPLNARSNLDSDWLFNKSQKKVLPSLKVDPEWKPANILEDNSPPTSEHSSKSCVKSGAEQSKPKSDVSDSNDMSEQSIEEELEEEISGVDELLSSISVGEDSTSDHTVSSVAGYDYIEKCNLKK